MCVCAYVYVYVYVYVCMCMCMCVCVCVGYDQMEPQTTGVMDGIKKLEFFLLKTIHHSNFLMNVFVFLIFRFSTKLEFCFRFSSKKNEKRKQKQKQKQNKKNKKYIKKKKWQLWGLSTPTLILSYPILFNLYPILSYPILSYYPRPRLSLYLVGRMEVLQAPGGIIGE